MTNAPDRACAAATIRSVTLRTREAARLTDFHRGALQLPDGLMRLEVDPRAVAAPTQAPGLFHITIISPPEQRVTQSDLPGARFMARGDYHHHVALNTWRNERELRRPAGTWA